MNQIPNIEETNSREEEIVAQFELNFTINDYECNGQRYYPNLPPLEISNWLRTTFHQELQKARKDWLWEEVKKLKVIKRSIEEFDYDCDERGKCEILQTIIDRYHSELDQPTPDIPGFEGTMEALDKLKI